MIALILRTFCTAIAVISALLLVPGLAIDRLLISLGFAFGLGFTNAILRPLMIRFSVGCSLITLAPILLIINTMAFFIVGDILKKGIMVEGFWPAFWGGLLVSIVSYAMMYFVSDGL